MQILPHEIPTLLLFMLISLQVKHFFADYVFQTKYMLRKNQPKRWLLPLTTHALVHGVTTIFALGLLLGFGQLVLFLGLVDFVLHFCIDLWKARFTEQNVFRKPFWISLGLDQAAHQVTYIALAYLTIHFVLKGTV